MDRSFRNIKLFGLEDRGLVTRKSEDNVSIQLEYDPHGLNLKCLPGDDEKPVLLEFLASKDVDYSRVGKQSCVFHVNSNTILFSFSSVAEFQSFHQIMMKLRTGQHLSVFNERTDEASSVQYFQFYGYLSQQQNMMQDYIRTSTYQRALLSNLVDFKDKIVLDVGAGSGILSFFAVQAGARKVYAVEASSMATHAETLVKANNLQNRITVIAGKIEEISLPEKVDVIVSEPMGYMLFNERMLETFLHAKKWLNPNGKMFPTKGDLHIVPFTDDALYMEQFNKANFWYQQCFHGVNLVSLRSAAIEEYFRQPIVDTFDIRICMSKSQRYTVDFQTALEDELHQIEIPLEFHLLQSGTIHGLAFWFDVAFIGTAQTVWLSTAPTEPLTHWYQVRCLLETPLFAKIGQMLTGKVVLSSNKRQSYDVTIELVVEGTNIKSNNTLDLKNPYFRYTGQPSQSPPGYNCASPSEAYWQQLDEQGARQVNGIQVNGIGDIAMDTSPAGLVSALANQANIHPGSIPATGQKQGVSNNPSSRSCPSSSSQLIGGAISPNMLTQNPTHQIVLGNTSHYPVSNNLMIGDYVAPTTVFLSPQSINSTFRT